MFCLQRNFAYNCALRESAEVPTNLAVSGKSEVNKCSIGGQRIGARLQQAVQHQVEMGLQVAIGVHRHVI
jgi:hypothetical protein